MLQFKYNVSLILFPLLPSLVGKSAIHSLPRKTILKILTASNVYSYCPETRGWTSTLRTGTSSDHSGLEEGKERDG